MTPAVTTIDPLQRPQVNLASMLDEVAMQVAAGKFGDVTECSVFLRGTVSNAIVTLPIEPVEKTAAHFDRAAQWLRTGELA